jgi:tRNA threonylcarbamoyladenosine biosynthesis protein TsaB
MLLLSIDTCGSLGTIALGRLKSTDNLEILAQTELPGKTYSAQLTPSIHQLLSLHNTQPAELAAIVVTNGPGSFTGIRIGLSTAKGLAEPTSIPILAVSRLAVLAHKAQTTAAALDASRHEFYFGDYSSPDSNPGAPNELWGGEESLLTGESFQQRAAALGRALAICEPSLQTLAPQATLVDPPTAADALRFALPRLRARDFDDPLLLDGNYIRRSDAEIFSKPGSRPASSAAPPNPARR